LEPELDTRLAPQPSARESGFSLLEILVVVTIIGIFLGVALLSTDLVSFERKLEREAVRLGTKLRFTSEEALMQSRDFGVLFYEEGYEFMLFEPSEGWLPAGGAGMEAVTLDEDMVLQLRMEGLDVVLDPRCEVFLCGLQETLSEERDDEPEVRPQIILFSSGEVTPFELEFLRESEILEPGYLLSVDFDGKHEVGLGDGY
jgi:general secretion pathway protein H